MTPCVAHGAFAAPHPVPPCARQRQRRQRSGSEVHLTPSSSLAVRPTYLTGVSTRGRTFEGAACRASAAWQEPASALEDTDEETAATQARLRRRDKPGRATRTLRRASDEVDLSIVELVEAKLEEDNSLNFAAYCDIMGKAEAYAAVASNLTFLSAKRDPEDIYATYKKLCTFVGTEEARALVIREPTALSCKPEQIRELLDAIVDALGEEDGREAVLKNPTLLAQGRLNHVPFVLPLLTKLLRSKQAAIDAVRRNSLLLGTPADTIGGAFATLCDLFGEEKALVMAMKHPGLLRSLPSTLTGSWVLLQEILGDRGLAEEALSRNSTLLKARPSTMQGAWEMLKMMWGDDARDAVLKQLGLLRSRPQTIQEAFNILTDLVGEDSARKLALSHPVLLQIRSRALISNYKVLQGSVGFEKAVQLIAVYPHTLMMRLGRLQQTLQLVEAVLGEGYRDHVSAAMIRMGPLRLQARVDSVIAVLGVVEGKALFYDEPVLLGCGQKTFEDRVPQLMMR